MRNYCDFHWIALSYGLQRATQIAYRDGVDEKKINQWIKHFRSSNH